MRLRSSRLLLCMTFLVLNILVQLFLLYMAGFWVPVLDSSSVLQKDCDCSKSDEPPLCSVPSSLAKLDPKNEISSEENLVEDSTHYLLLVLILTSASGAERRDLARQTWMRYYQEVDQVLVKFAVGTHGLFPEQLNSLYSEQSTYGDLLLLPDLQEAYMNLTRKILHSFVEVVKRFSFSYLLKCDDDSFVLLDKFVEELSARDEQRSLYWGFFDGRAHIKTKGKWTEEDWFLCDRYLPYALGGGYVLSHDLVQRIAAAADGLALYNSEDVSVGVWLSPYQAERKHDVRFNTEFVSRGCRDVHIVSHKQSISDIKSKYMTLQKRGVQCEREYQTRLSYEYNWKTVPTKCCERREGIP